MKNEITAKRLKKALDNNNMIPQELAEKSEVSKASISQYLSGMHAPSNISSGKMAKVLKVEPLWLMGFDVPMKKIDAPPESLAEQDAKLPKKIALLTERDRKIIIDMVDSMLKRKSED